MKKFINRNNVILFAIAFVVTIVTAIICHFCGAERVTTLLTAPAVGVFSVMGVGALFDIEDMPMPMGPEAGFLGVIVAALLNIVLF